MYSVHSACVLLKDGSNIKNFRGFDATLAQSIKINLFNSQEMPTSFPSEGRLLANAFLSFTKGDMVHFLKIVYFDFASNLLNFSIKIFQSNLAECSNHFKRLTCYSSHDNGSAVHRICSRYRK